MRKLLFTSTAVIRALAFMSFDEACATVFVKSDNGPVRINASDYDAAKHELVDLPAPVAVQEQPQPAADVQNNGIRDTPQPEKVPGTEDGETIEDEAKEGVIEHSAVSDQRGVVKNGKKFFVTDMAGVKIDALGIDPNGYNTEAEAWAAVVAAPVA